MQDHSSLSDDDSDEVDSDHGGDNESFASVDELSGSLTPRTP